MIKFLKNYKNYIYLITLLVLYIVFAAFTWGKHGHVFYDCFREAVIPQAMLGGKILYRDILNLYPPFAYQINSILFKIFGCKLSVLYGCGIVWGLAILYTMNKTLRVYFSDFTAFIVTLCAMGLFTFRISVNNLSSWIFPYSYSFLYAFTFAFFSICLYLISKKDAKDNPQKFFERMCIISLLTGISLAFKWDFLMVCIIPVFEAIKSRSFKDFCIFFGLMILPGILSFAGWLLCGGSIFDFCNWINFLIDFSKAPSVIDFNRNSLPQVITADVAENIFSSLKIFFKTFGSFTALFFLFFTFIPKVFKNKILQFILLIVFVYFVCVPCFSLFSFEAFQAVGTNKNLVFVPYLVWFSAFGIFAVRKIRKENFTESEKIFVMLALTGLLLMFRSFAEVKLSSVGNFTIIPYFIAFMLLFVELLPEYINFFDKIFLKKIFIFSFLLFCCSISVNYLSELENFTEKIQTEKGIIYLPEKKASVISDAVNYLDKSVPDGSKVIVVNEGLIFNWFTGKSLDLKHYALIPHMIEAEGEEKIIEYFEKNPIDYFFVTDNYYPYVGFFGIDYGKNLNNYIERNYDRIETFSSQYCKLVVWKKKQTILQRTK